MRSDNLNTVIQVVAATGKTGARFVLVWTMVAFWSFIGLTAAIVTLGFAIDPPAGRPTDIALVMISLAYVAWAVIMVHAIGISIWRGTR